MTSFAWMTCPIGPMAGRILRAACPARRDAPDRPDAAVLPAIAPLDDEILLPKTASSVFNATHIDYVLRNLGVEHLAIAGVLTEQCVESAVRDACDRGYRVTLVTDACTSITAQRHANALLTTAGYCRQLITAELLAELPPTTP